MPSHRTKIGTARNVHLQNHEVPTQEETSRIAGSSVTTKKAVVIVILRDILYLLQLFVF